MTNHVVRLYALALATLVFFLAWAVVAAHPWQQQKAAVDPRVAALTARRVQLKKEAAYVNRVVAHRFAVYHAALKKREQAIAKIRVQLAAERARQARAAAAAAQMVSSPAPAASSSPRVVTITTYTPAASAPAATAPASAPAPAPAPAPTPAPVAAPPVVSVPAATTTHTS
jgi:uncharacterized protein (DUF3084 family)